MKTCLAGAIFFLLSFSLVSQSKAQSHSQDAAQSSLKFVERPDEELLILQMQLGRYVLSDGVIGYSFRGGVLLSFEDVIMALEFPIVVDPYSGQASGWFLNESRIFALDVSNQEVIVDGIRQSYQADLVEIHEDGIYVDASLFNKWFSVRLDVNMSRLSIGVSSKEKLPIELQLEREKKQKLLGGREIFQPDYPRFNSSYSLLDWPTIDAFTNLYYRSPENGGREARSSALISSDFLYMSSVLFLAGIDDDSLTDIRFYSGRSDPDGNLLGPLKAQSFELGDIYNKPIPLISNNRAGRGIEISSFPLNRPTEFDRTTLQGDLPPNWEVELYRNEILLDFQLASEDGRYEFNDVPLLYGSNVLRLIFYGPQGQKREEVKTLYVGSELIRPGEGRFRVSATQQEKYLFLDKASALDSSLIGEGRFIAQYELGLDRTLSLSASGVSLPNKEGRRIYGNLGLRAALLGSFSRIDISAQEKGGTAIQFATQRNLFGNDLFVEHNQLFDFESERFGDFSDPVKSQTRVRLYGTVPIWLIRRLSFGLDGFLEHRESGTTYAELTNRLSIYFRGISLTHTLSGSELKGGNSEYSRRVNAQLLASGRIKKLSLRAQLSYDPPPHHQFKTASFTSDYYLGENFNARFTVNRDLLIDRWTDYSVGINQTFDAFLLGIEGRYEDNENYSIRLSISFSLSWQEHNNRAIISSQRMGNYGSVSALVFLDKNQNGKFDEEDIPIEGARLRYGGRTSAPTNEKGITYVNSLYRNRLTNVSIELGSLDDPFWFPTSEGFEIVPRPGKTVDLEFPIVGSGEIEGTVYLQRGSSIKAASNVEIQLITARWESVQKIRTAYDGYFLFTKVPPGLYVVRVSKDQMDRLNLKTPKIQRVTIEENAEIVSGIDFTIIKEEASEME